jgi:salicylate hydroxylase
MDSGVGGSGASTTLEVAGACATDPVHPSETTEDTSSSCTSVGREDETVSTAKRPRVDDGLRVVIAGGGLGGLALCLALQKAGISARVYERDAQFDDRRQGYGLTLTNSKKGALAELGVLEACIKQDCPSCWHWVLDPKGHVLGYYGRSFTPGAAKKVDAPARRGERGNLRIPRQDLRKMLLDRLAPGSVVWGRRVVGYVEQGDVVDAQLDNGAVVQADVLVGADGIRSVVRRVRDAVGKGDDCTGLRYTGVAVIIGLSPAEHPLLDDGGFYVLDGVHRLFTMPFRQRGANGDPEAPPLTMWQLSFSGLTEMAATALGATDAAALLAEAQRRTAGWFDPVSDLIAATPSVGGSVWSTALYDRDPLPPLSRDRGSLITIIGDAAHPMTMFKGQGANQALLDAPLLAKWLAKPGKLTATAVRTRLRCFEREMTARSTPKVLGSRQAAAHLHQPAALDERFGIEGVPEDAAGLLQYLRDNEVTASLGAELEPAVAHAIGKLSK